MDPTARYNGQQSTEEALNVDFSLPTADISEKKRRKPKASDNIDTTRYVLRFEHRESDGTDTDGTPLYRTQSFTADDLDPLERPLDPAPPAGILLANCNNHGFSNAGRADGLALGDERSKNAVASDGAEEKDARVARFNRPHGVAVSSDGAKVVVADTFNDCVREIYLDGLVSQHLQKGQPPRTVWRVRTVSGAAASQQQQKDCDGPLHDAVFARPVSVSFAPLDEFGGNSDTNTGAAGPRTGAEGVLVADWGNHRVRLMRPHWLTPVLRRMMRLSMAASYSRWIEQSHWAALAMAVAAAVATIASADAAVAAASIAELAENSPWGHMAMKFRHEHDDDDDADSEDDAANAEADHLLHVCPNGNCQCLNVIKQQQCVMCCGPMAHGPDITSAMDSAAGGEDEGAKEVAEKATVETENGVESNTEASLTTASSLHIRDHLLSLRSRARRRVRRCRFDAAKQMVADREALVEGMTSVHQFDATVDVGRRLWRSQPTSGEQLGAMAKCILPEAKLDETVVRRGEQSAMEAEQEEKDLKEKEAEEVEQKAQQEEEQETVKTKQGQEEDDPLTSKFADEDEKADALHQQLGVAARSASGADSAAAVARSKLDGTSSMQQQQAVKEMEDQQQLVIDQHRLHSRWSCCSDPSGGGWTRVPAKNGAEVPAVVAAALRTGATGLLGVCAVTSHCGSANSQALCWPPSHPTTSGDTVLHLATRLGDPLLLRLLLHEDWIQRKVAETEWRKARAQERAAEAGKKRRHAKMAAQATALVGHATGMAIGQALGGHMGVMNSANLNLGTARNIARFEGRFAVADESSTGHHIRSGGDGAAPQITPSKTVNTAPNVMETGILRPNRAGESVVALAESVDGAFHRQGLERELGWEVAVLEDCAEFCLINSTAAALRLAHRQLKALFEFCQATETVLHEHEHTLKIKRKQARAEKSEAKGSDGELATVSMRAAACSRRVNELRVLLRELGKQRAAQVLKHTQLKRTLRRKIMRSLFMCRGGDMEQALGRKVVLVTAPGEVSAEASGPPVFTRVMNRRGSMPTEARSNGSSVQGGGIGWDFDKALQQVCLAGKLPGSVTGVDGGSDGGSGTSGGAVSGGQYVGPRGSRLQQLEAELLLDDEGAYADWRREQRVVRRGEERKKLSRQMRKSSATRTAEEEAQDAVAAAAAAPTSVSPVSLDPFVPGEWIGSTVGIGLHAHDMGLLSPIAMLGPVAASGPKLTTEHAGFNDGVGARKLVRELRADVAEAVRLQRQFGTEGPKNGGKYGKPSKAALAALRAWDREAAGGEDDPMRPNYVAVYSVGIRLEKQLTHAVQTHWPKVQYVGEIDRANDDNTATDDDEHDDAIAHFNCPAVGDTMLTLLLRLQDRVLLQAALDLCPSAGRKYSGHNVRQQSMHDLAGALGLGGLLVWGCAVVDAFQRLGRLKHLQKEADADGDGIDDSEEEDGVETKDKDSNGARSQSAIRRDRINTQRIRIVTAVKQEEEHRQVSLPRT
jgi:hypothetical protein